MKNKFPPACLADLDRRSAGAFSSLAHGLHHRATSLFLGAGVSASAGIPDWNNFLARICAAFFAHWAMDPTINHLLPPRNLSIVFWDAFDWEDYQFWDKDIPTLAEEFAKGNPLLVAQQIKNCIRGWDWRYLLNKVLYGNESSIQSSALIESLARFCKNHSLVSSVVNYNYDSLFEEQLSIQKIPHNVIWASENRSRHNRLPVLHPHGYLKRGGGPLTPIILGEADYYESSRTPYSWPDGTLMAYLTSHTCIFIGHSMTDPNVRRMLRSSHTISGQRHFAFLPNMATSTDRNRMFQALFDRDLLHLGVSVIRYPMRKSESGEMNSHSRLPELLDLLMLLGADAQQLRNVFNDRAGEICDPVEGR